MGTRWWRSEQSSHPPPRSRSLPLPRHPPQVAASQCEAGFPNRCCRLKNFKMLERVSGFFQLINLNLRGFVPEDVQIRSRKPSLRLCSWKAWFSYSRISFEFQQSDRWPCTSSLERQFMMWWVVPIFSCADGCFRGSTCYSEDWPCVLCPILGGFDSVVEPRIRIHGDG